MFRESPVNRAEGDNNVEGTTVWFFGLACNVMNGRLLLFLPYEFYDLIRLLSSSILKWLLLPINVGDISPVKVECWLSESCYNMRTRSGENWRVGWAGKVS